MVDWAREGDAKTVPRGVEAGAQPADHRRIDLADDLGIALSDRVERAVAQADDAAMMVERVNRRVDAASAGLGREAGQPPASEPTERG